MAAANYHGECICARKDCALKAYYKQSGKPFCGRHSAQPARTKLPVNPDKDKNLALAFANHMLYVEAHRVDNVALGERGTVICCKMTMFQGQQPVFVDGYINVFANYKHANRYGGLGMPDLSPKSMGPVEHPQPGLPPSKNLENFHQFSKRFPGETMKEFREAQRKAFADPEPHRHKPQALKQKGNKNIPKYWVWTCPDGKSVV